MDKKALDKIKATNNGWLIGLPLLIGLLLVVGFIAAASGLKKATNPSTEFSLINDRVSDVVFVQRQKRKQLMFTVNGSEGHYFSRCASPLMENSIDLVGRNVAFHVPLNGYLEQRGKPNEQWTLGLSVEGRVICTFESAMAQEFSNVWTELVAALIIFVIECVLIYQWILLRRKVRHIHMQKE